MFKELVEQAGLKPRHLQKFFKCSRVAASSWINGHSSPHAMLAPKVALFNATVQRALDDGKLPVPDSLPFSEANTYINDTLRRYARAVVEASKNK